jgi:hypothetical protein
MGPPQKGSFCEVLKGMEVAMGLITSMSGNILFASGHHPSHLIISSSIACLNVLMI